MFRQIKSLFSGGKVDIENRFELLREAIHGTMSNFYQARDRNTGDIFGLKLLDVAKTAKAEQRFAGLNKPSEGQIAVSLDHPFIVKTFEHGTTTKNEPFLLMEYLEGQGLNSLILSGSEDLDRHAVDLIRQAAEATAGVHAAGFIHRDICPRNFVVAPDCQSLKLIDFGLTVPNSPPFRRPGNRTGTPRYMAPEVVRRKTTDHRLDVFSFGVTAYEMLSSESPWPRLDTTGKAAMDHDKPPTSIVERCPDIDPDLAEAIHRCLQPEPDQRPESMEAFLQMIRNVQVAR
ncbi:MAG: serine/threonine-protein kinase [Pirellulales bacterium]